jgi:hypothetical protein
LGTSTVPIDFDGVVHDPRAALFDGGGAAGEQVTVTAELEEGDLEATARLSVCSGCVGRQVEERHTSTVSGNQILSKRDMLRTSTATKRTAPC